jgi:hypothetical protein
LKIKNHIYDPIFTADAGAAVFNCAETGAATATPNAVAAVCNVADDAEICDCAKARLAASGSVSGVNCADNDEKADWHFVIWFCASESIAIRACNAAICIKIWEVFIVIFLADGGYDPALNRD